jgi:hypothetical protein
MILPLSSGMLIALVTLAGAGQLVLALGSLSIPRVLGWREETARLRPLTREVFWTYAGYIWVTNMAMGLGSLLGAAALVQRQPLAAAVSAYVAVYWGARLVIQLTCFDRTARPAGRLFQLAEWALIGLFAYLTLVFGLATAVALGALSLTAGR